ncbi:hypothetical protein GOP47_0019687, partial [Adiantum capillus-veneris]
EKIEGKLHHKKDEPQPAATATPGLNQPQPHKEGVMGKIKNKVKGGPGEGGSSSSSESDGEGGRRKKKVGMA